MCITNNDCPNIWWLDETLEIPTSKKTSHKNKHEWLLFKCNKFFFKYFCVAHFKYNISRIKRMKCLPFFWINYWEVGTESSHQISTSALPYLDCSSISAITRFNLDLFCQCITKTNRNSFWEEEKLMNNQIKTNKVILACSRQYIKNSNDSSSLLFHHNSFSKRSSFAHSKDWIPYIMNVYCLHLNPILPILNT